MFFFFLQKKALSTISVYEIIKYIFSYPTINFYALFYI